MLSIFIELVTWFFGCLALGFSWRFKKPIALFVVDCMKNTASKVFILAVFSFIVSFYVADSFDNGGWQYYSCLSIVDVMFMSMFGLVNIELTRKRWISVLLFISICSSLLLALGSFLYQYKILELMSVEIAQAYTVLSVCISYLIVAVAVIPKGILRIWDGICWPKCLADIYCCDILCSMEAVKISAQKSRESRWP